jgi:RNA polymerase sigma-70 factor (ECF subfamily)
VELKNLGDTKLVELTANKNILAFEELYKRYSRLVFTLTLKICNEQVLAEQIFLQVFATIFNKAKLFPFDTDNAYAWIVMLARNRAVDSIRRNRASERVDLIYDDEFENKYILPVLSHKVDALDYETAVRISKDIYSAYQKLTDMQRTVLELAFFQGFTANEIAANLKLPVETIRSKMMYSIFTLRDKLLRQDSNDINENLIIYEFISAFALGCLEKKNYDSFLEYYNAGKLKESELNNLGVIQNIVTLIPLVFDPVNPPENFFENIKNYLISTGISFSESMPYDLVEEQAITTNYGNEKLEENNNIQNKQNFDVEINLSKGAADNFNEEKESKTDNSTLDESSKFKNLINGFPKRQKILFYGSIILTFISLIFLVIIIQTSSSNINELEKRLEIAEEKVSKSYNFIKDYQTYIDFTNQGNFKVIQLKDTSGFVAARLYLSLVNDEGLLQIDNLPNIQSDEEYTLQSVKSGISTKLLTFIVKNNGKYLWVKGKPEAKLLSADLFKIEIHKKNKKQAEGIPLFWGN